MKTLYRDFINSLKGNNNKPNQFKHELELIQFLGIFWVGILGNLFFIIFSEDRKPRKLITIFTLVICMFTLPGFKKIYRAAKSLISKIRQNNYYWETPENVIFIMFVYLLTCIVLYFSIDWSETSSFQIGGGVGFLLFSHIVRIIKTKREEWKEQRELNNKSKKKSK
jgi:hypothetical protein